MRGGMVKIMRLFKKSYLANMWVLNNLTAFYRATKGFVRATLNKHTLRSIEIYPTMKCNMQCTMCSVEKYKEKAKKALGLEDYERIASECARLGCISVTLLGGEPMLSSMTEDIIGVFKRKKFFVFMISNGSMATHERLISLRKAGLDGVAFSLNSMLEEGNAETRGKGYLETIFEAVDTSLSVGLVTRVAPVFFPGKIQDAIDVIEYAASKGCGASCSQVAPVGGWEGGQVLSSEENDSIRELVKKYPNMTLDWTMSYFMRPCCPAGKEKISITTSGDVCGCSINPISFGNVKEESIQKIMERMQAFSQFKKNASVCLSAEDSFYIDNYLSCLSGFSKYPVDWHEHPNIRTDNEADVFAVK